MAKEGSKKFLGIGAAVVIAAAIGFIVYRSALAPDLASDLASDLSSRTFIDAEGQTFEHSTKPNSGPIVNPKTGKPGYLAEWCWWTKDGAVRDKPFAVLLNDHLGKPGPTFCPDCGRLVVGHNPSPKAPGVTIKPPPTQASYRE